MTFERIRVDTNKMGGVACIRDLRIPVSTIIGMVASGFTYEEILADYPDLEIADIQEALVFGG